MKKVSSWFVIALDFKVWKETLSTMTTTILSSHMWVKVAFKMRPKAEREGEGKTEAIWKNASRPRPNEGSPVPLDRLAFSIQGSGFRLLHSYFGSFPYVQMTAIKVKTRFRIDKYFLWMNVQKQRVKANWTKESPNHAHKSQGLRMAGIKKTDFWDKTSMPHSAHAFSSSLAFVHGETRSWH